MKNRKNTIKRGGAYGFKKMDPFTVEEAQILDNGEFKKDPSAKIRNKEVEVNEEVEVKEAVKKDPNKLLGGSKRKSRKSRKSRKTKKTKKGRGTYEGGKKKCPKHCHRHTRRTRKGLKHRKN